MLALFLALAQAPIWRANGLTAEDASGSAVAGLGDVNGDGIPDVAIGAPYSDLAAADGGSVTVRSGLDGAELFTWVGSFANARYGMHLAGPGDLDGDGIPDVAICAEAYTGIPYGAPQYVSLVSGKDGSVLHLLNGFALYPALNVAGVGDVDLDGFPDLAVAFQNHPDSGVRLFSGRTGEMISDLLDSASFNLGSGLAGLGDVNGDGVPDVLVGDAYYTDSAPGAAWFAGAAWVFSGADGTELVEVNGTSTYQAYGQHVAALGDVDGDGASDFAVGSSTVTELRSGSTGALLGSLPGSAGLAGPGDVNRDGCVDVAIGLVGLDTVEIRSACDGSLLLSYTPPVTGLNFGGALDRAGDLDQDGILDVIVGAPTGAGSATALSLMPKGLAAFGTGTPGCAGPHHAGGTLVPKAGASAFAFTSEHLPPSALGLLLVGDASDVGGSDPFGLGVLLHVDLPASLQILALNLVSDAEGNGLAPAPIPGIPALVGAVFYAQSLSLWPPSCALTPYRLSSSNGIRLTIQAP